MDISIIELPVFTRLFASILAADLIIVRGLAPTIFAQINITACGDILYIFNHSMQVDCNTCKFAPFIPITFYWILDHVKFNFILKLWIVIQMLLEILQQSCRLFFCSLLFPIRYIQTSNTQVFAKFDEELRAGPWKYSYCSICLLWQLIYGSIEKSVNLSHKFPFLR